LLHADFVIVMVKFISCGLQAVLLYPDFSIRPQKAYTDWTSVYALNLIQGTWDSLATTNLLPQIWLRGHVPDLVPQSQIKLKDLVSGRARTPYLKHWKMCAIPNWSSGSLSRCVRCTDDLKVFGSGACQPDCPASQKVKIMPDVFSKTNLF
jgi:hypothetical protein